jgi:hypothetical protein
MTDDEKTETLTKIAMLDLKPEMDLIHQRIMAILGVSEAMMNGPTTYATSSIGYGLAKALEYEAAFEDAGFVALEASPKGEEMSMEKRAVVLTPEEKIAHQKLKQQAKEKQDAAKKKEDTER